MTNHFQVWYGIPLVLAAIVAGCGSPSAALPAASSAPGPASPPAQPQACGTGLAAVDLAGNCRNPNGPTPGALEAVSG